jgi:alpha-amylase
LAVTVIDNHDTQPLQALEAPVEPWFKPLAHALILLRDKGYPCIFYPDLYSATYKDKGHDSEDYEIFLPATENIEKLLQLRKKFAYGTQRDYLDHPNCIGWTREGDDDHPGSGCAVVMSNGDEGFKTMDIGSRHTGKSFIDFLGKHPGKVIIGENGQGVFFAPPGNVSVWIEAT